MFVIEVFAAQMRLLHLLQILGSALAIFPHVKGQVTSESTQKGAEVRETHCQLCPVPGQLPKVRINWY